MKNTSINILMIGGQYAGNADILSGMLRCCTETLRGQSIIEIAAFKQTIVSLVTKGLTKGLDEYVYEVRIKNSKYTFTFTDVPGEAYSPEKPGEDIKIKEIRAKLPDLIAKNHIHILIIAVDTPHLMESPYNEDGVCEYHKEFNYPDEITDFIKKNFTADEDKLVVFVPIRCEKYYYNGKMDKIPELIEKGYPDLFGFFKSEKLNDRFSVIIDPVLTLGNKVFFCFEDDPSAVGNYVYVQNAALRRYSPKCCDIPVYLIIIYMIQIAKNNPKRFAYWFGQPIFDRASLKEFINAEKIVKDLINKNKPQGFKVIQDPLGLGL